MGANLTVLYSALIEHPLTKFQQNPSKILRKWRLRDIMSRDFGSKNGQLSGTSRMYDFEVKRQLRTPKRQKLMVLKSYLGFLFQFLIPKMRICKTKCKIRDANFMKIVPNPGNVILSIF